jgi:hypothetical protein
MAACFCGCGRKVGFGDRGYNKQGRRTAELVGKLREAQEAVPADAPHVMDDPDFTLAEEIDGTGNAGEHFMDFWADLIHGDDSRPAREIRTTRMYVGGDILSQSGFGGFESYGDTVPPLQPQEAMAIKREWMEWRAEAKALLNAAERVT